MSGAYTSLEELITFAPAGKRIPLYNPQAATATMAGNYRSRIRGRGMNFEDFRPYQSGDDVRAIDWKVSARTGQTYTRVYREERERPVLLVLDQGPRLFFGSQLNFKSVTAIEAMALFAWSALYHGDRVGALISGAEHREFKPQHAHGHVLQLLHAAVQMNHSLKAGLQQDHTLQDQMLAISSRLVHPGSLVIVVSDFHDITAQGLEQMSRIARHNDLVLVQVCDPFDRELPPPGRLFVSNGQQHAVLDSADRRCRQQYRQQAEQRQLRLTEHLTSWNIPLRSLSCGQPTIKQLLRSPRFVEQPDLGVS